MVNRKYIIPVIVLVMAIALVAGCTSSEKTVKMGDNVTLDYTEAYTNGTIIDSSNATVAEQAGIYDPTVDYEPLNFIVGDDNIIPGFSNETIGMKIGDTKNFTLTPDQAYGEYNTSLILPVPMSVLTAYNITPHVNDTLYNNGMPVRVDHIVPNATDPNNTSVYIDYNHPLAGKTLVFTITITDIQSASSTA